MTIDIMPTNTTAINRILNWDACLNVRELGGLATRDGRLTRRGSFVRSDNLHRLTPQGIEALRAYRIRTIIDLRYPSETQSAPHHFQSDQDGANQDGVRYMHISLLGDDGGEVAMRDRTLSNRFEWTSMSLDHCASAYAGVMQVIAEAPEGGVLFHCAGGKDRTGMVAMLLLSLADVCRVDIVDDYILSDDCLREANAQWLARYADDPEYLALIERNMYCLPQTMEQTLDYLNERYDGAETYLRDAGLSIDEINRIRARLI